MTCTVIVSTFHSFYKLGSSLTFSVQGGRDKEKKLSAEKIGSPSEGAAEGGCGGNSAALELKSRIKCGINSAPAALLVESRTPKKSFIFLLEEKIRRAQNQKCKQNFSLVWRALASGGGAERVSSAQKRFGFRQTNAPKNHLLIKR